MAEAKVIREKAMAEAEAKEKLAVAYAKYGEAAMFEMLIKVLPEVTKSSAEAVTAAMAQIGSITVIDSGENSKGATKIADYSVDLLTKVPASIKATTGIDIVKMLSKFTDNIDGANLPSENSKINSEDNV